MTGAEYLWIISGLIIFSYVVGEVLDLLNLRHSSTEIPIEAKGVYDETTLSKGRSTPIVYTAVRKYLLDGTKIEHTITECKDINEFVSARTVKGGGVYEGNYLGKMVRWYYSTASKGCISYKTNGNKVPKTDGCKPMMDLTSDIPDDLDLIWYFDEAIEALKNLGVDYHAK